VLRTGNHWRLRVKQGPNGLKCVCDGCCAARWQTYRDTVSERAAQAVGLWSSVLVAVCSAAFGLSLLAGLLVQPLAAVGLTASFVASFVLAPAFVAMLVSLAEQAPADRRVWGRLGVAFASVYAALVMTTYYVQLVVVPRAADTLPPDAVVLLTFAPGFPLFAVDMLGYGLMTLATLVAAPLFQGPGLDRWLRGWFVAHGLLGVPTLVAPALFAGGPADDSSLIGTLVLIGWSVFFVPLAVLVGVYFARARTRPSNGRVPTGAVESAAAAPSP
jgi:hypothetical protein